MIAVIFELWPAEGQEAAYFDLAANLRTDLEKIDGFLSVERFQSLADPAKYLSLSFFRDEQSAAAWRNFPSHRASQTLGRTGVFADYRLRVASVLRDYGLHQRDQAPPDSRTAHAALTPLT